MPTDWNRDKFVKTISFDKELDLKCIGNKWNYFLCIAIVVSFLQIFEDVWSLLLFSEFFPHLPQWLLLWLPCSHLRREPFRKPCVMWNYKVIIGNIVGVQTEVAFIDTGPSLHDSTRVNLGWYHKSPSQEFFQLKHSLWLIWVTWYLNWVPRNTVSKDPLPRHRRLTN